MGAVVLHNVAVRRKKKKRKVRNAPVALQSRSSRKSWQRAFWTLHDIQSLARGTDLERFLSLRRSHDALSGESSSVAEAEADVVSVPLTPTEVADGVYIRERRAALSGSAD
jgi:hypothetical protein